MSTFVHTPMRTLVPVLFRNMRTLVPNRSLFSSMVLSYFSLTTTWYWAWHG